MSIDMLSKFVVSPSVDTWPTPQRTCCDQQSLVYQSTVSMVVSVITVVLSTGGGVLIVYAHMLTERHAAPTAVILNAT